MTNKNLNPIPADNRPRDEHGKYVKYAQTESTCAELTAPEPATISSDDFDDHYDPQMSPSGDLTWLDSEITGVPIERVWTLVEAEGNIYAVAGIHFVNRLGYVVTAEPWPGDDAEAEWDVRERETCPECHDDVEAGTIEKGLCESCREELICPGDDCGERNDNGEGWDGYCGNCADKRTCPVCGETKDVDDTTCGDRECITEHEENN